MIIETEGFTKYHGKVRGVENLSLPVYCGLTGAWFDG